MPISLGGLKINSELPLRCIGIKAPDYFEGREDELATMLKAFEEGKRMIVLSGIGGIGKSELATQFICSNNLNCPQKIALKDNEEVTWYNILNKFIFSEDILKGFVNLQSANFDMAYAMLKDALAQLDEDVILFIDNANLLNEDFLDELIMELRCKILITTRNEINVPKEAVNLVVKEMSVNIASNIFAHGYGNFREGEDNLFKSAVYDDFYGNTRAIVMISKMLKTHGLSLKEYKIKRKDAIRDNKFRFNISGENRFDTIANNLCESLKITDVSLSDSQRTIIAILILVEQTGIAEKAIIQYLNLSTSNDFIILAESGFISRTLSTDGMYIITMHPLIAKMFEIYSIKPAEDEIVFVSNYYYNCFANDDFNIDIDAYRQTNAKIVKYVSGSKLEEAFTEAAKDAYFTFVSDEVDLFDILLDEENIQELILKDNLGVTTKYEQVAIIPYDEKLYCVLKPLDELPGIESDQAIVFYVDVNDDGNSILRICIDEKIAQCVFDEYLKLLAEAINN